MGCCRRDLCAPRRILGRSQNVRSVRKSNRRIKRFVARMRFWRGTPSFAGIILLIAAAIGMPWLARQKRKLATQIGSASLRADATESALCGYLSFIALAGLLANALLHTPWADPIAALALVPLIAKEGWHAIHASRTCCK